MTPEQPLLLADADEAGHTALKRWRLRAGIDPAQAAERLDISASSYYRYESGQCPQSTHKVNQIVRTTRGAVRYRDLIVGFDPRYA